LTPSQNPEQEKQPPRVSIVVVSHNRAESLRRCLQSIENAQGRETMQVIAIDNGSTDGSERMDAEFPHLQWVRLPKNFGLTKALNLGWRAADAPYVYFVHDDTELDTSGILSLAEVLDAHPEAAAACPLLVDADGHPAPQLGSLPPTGEWRPAAPVGDDLVPVEYPRGAALMVRIFNIKAIRQIDERYGQFGADADLAAQIKRASRKILLVPQAHVRHHGRLDYSALERADFLHGRAVFLGKYLGTGAKLRAQIGSALAALAGFRLGEFKYLLAGQKIDGTQT
jgi:GT2 family glycosyltransferase